jgi:acetylxylan esterase
MPLLHAASAGRHTTKMKRTWSLGLVGAGALLTLAPAAHAASLQQVNNWKGGANLPADVLMFAYVPDKVAAKPPILAVIHYCGGSAQAVFGQAQGGGLVAAADKYGFVLVVPSNANASGQNGRCWDVTSKASQTRDGGGDTHAINQMVKYGITQYHANAERVYVTGDSSGGMTTQLLLALYPEVYKGGSSFAGVPAGCQNAFDGAGLCGLGTQTAQQWGDRARAMSPSYTGRRPRVQLFHGDADATIKYPNFGEAIKEWTNVLGLPTSPSMTDMNVTLGNHKATRQRWKNQCGYTTLDTFSSIGGDHGPSDALFEADYVVPFLALDNTGEVDPEVQQCSGMGGAGGTGAGGTGAGGTSAGGTSAGGAGPSGGTAGMASGGSFAGGAAGAGGSGALAGSGNVAGASTGGTPSAGGSNSGAGSPGAAGSAAMGGTGAATGGASGVAGQATTPGGSAGAPSDEDAAGCSCRVGSRSSGSSWLSVVALGLGLGLRRRRREA